MLLVKSSQNMKVGKILLVLLFAAITSYSQNKSLGVGTATPNPNAALHVESPTNNQGFIMPRLTTVQRTGMGSLLTSADNGLMLYDTNLKTIFIWDGAAWKNTAEVAGGSRLSYPYKDSVTSTLTGNDVFALKYNNAANKRVLRIESLSATNGSSAVSVQQNGTGIGIFSRVDNPAAGTSAVFGTTNSNLGGAVAPVGVYGESTGTGSLGAAFRVNNAANNFPAVYAETNGIGSAARLVSLNAASTAPALVVVNAGTGSAIQTTGKIQAGEFIGNGSGLTNVTASNPRLTLPYQDSVLTAPAGSNLLKLFYGGTAPGNVGLAYVENINPLNGFSPLFARTNGTGAAAQIIVNNSSNTNAALAATTNGTTAIRGSNIGTGNGFAGLFQNTNATNNFPAIQANTVGTGPGVRVLQNATSAGSGIDVILQNTTGAAVGFSVNQQGLGASANFNVNNVTNGVSAINANTNGTGNAGFFGINNVANSSAGVFASTNGTGAAIQGQTSTGFTAVYGRREGATNGNAGSFEITDAGNTFPALQARTVGTGSAGNFQVNNTSSTTSAVVGQTNGALFSAGVYGHNTGSGFGVVGRSNGTAIGSAAVYGEQLGTGDAAGAFRINNAANTSNAIYGETNGTASAINAAQFGTGTGLLAQIVNVANTSNALRVLTNGTGNGILVNHTGASGNLAVFQSSGENAARIDKTGKGFFNGGTQTGGADLAEMFDVEGSRQNYEPGDVLVISETSDRTVEKSSAANSSKVVGVYATKPGVTLTEKGMDENLDELIPMGVIGVIPTKVCLENGPIKRGDLLVTSSKQGHAMKAMPVNVGGVLIYPAGAILGKALENFDSQESGLIKVLVNVK
jgi:hypothetical protein